MPDHGNHVIQPRGLVDPSFKSADQEGQTLILRKQQGWLQSLCLNSASYQFHIFTLPTSLEPYVWNF
jgi:hypothetical protein